MCHVLEDESRFSLQCNMFTDERTDFLCQIQNKYSMFMFLDNTAKLIFLLQNEDTQIITWTAKFKPWKKRIIGFITNYDEQLYYSVMQHEVDALAWIPFINRLHAVYISFYYIWSYFYSCVYFRNARVCLYVHSRQVVSCPVQPRACHWDSVFWHNVSGMKRTCWATGSWRCCLSLEVMSSISTGSTIICRILCRFICVSLCQSIKIKPTNMYIASARAHFKINTHGYWKWHLCIPGGLSIVQCRLGHVIGIMFFFLHNFSSMKRTCWTTGSWWCCVEVVISIPAGSTIIYRIQN